MGQICLDSDVLIDALRHKRSLKGRFTTTSVNAFELSMGAKQKERVDSLLTILCPIPFSTSAASVAALMQKHLSSIGKPLPARDVFIGATCIASKCPLATNNLKDFLPMAPFGLKILKSFKA